MLLFRDPNANYSSSNVGRFLNLTTDRAGLVGEFAFGRDLATSRVNAATLASTDAQAIGSPAYGDHKITNINYQNTLDLMVGDAENITVAAVFAYGGSASRIYMATGPGGVLGQLALFQLSDTVQRLQVATSAGSVSGLSIDLTGAPAAPTSEFRMVSGRVGGLVNPSLAIDEFKGGVRVKGNTATGTATRVVDTRKVALGTLRNSSLANPSDFAAALVWHRVLTDSELLSAYGEVRTALAVYGIAC
ncbi:hypothetical protein VQ042_11515 [Aurantimonas sp. A2-1-M11]|uniref:hypothetical protein n=1 Tax=Aurantimonas sp. A2-1-M11 TaxID=3113712 RepID=UPI002F932747